MLKNILYVSALCLSVLLVLFALSGLPILYQISSLAGVTSEITIVFGIANLFFAIAGISLWYFARHLEGKMDPIQLRRKEKIWKILIYFASGMSIVTLCNVLLIYFGLPHLFEDKTEVHIWDVLFAPIILVFFLRIMHRIEKGKPLDEVIDSE